MGLILQRIGILEASASPFQAAATAFFDGDEASRPWAGSVTFPSSLHVSDKTYITWESVVGSGKVIRIISFDHATATWSDIYQVGHFDLPDDDHGAPALCQDADGYFYCFFGSHNSDQQWAISDSADDISAWTEQTPISGSYTYPKPVVVGSKIHLFLRDYDGSNYPLVHLEATPSGGAASFGAATELVDFDNGAGGRVYTSAARANGTDIEFVATRGDFLSSGSRKHVYYFAYDTTSGDISNLSGGTTTAAASLPINLTTANASYREVDSGSNVTSLPKWCRDTSGDLHILYIDDSTDPYDLKHNVHSGGSWGSATTLTTLDDKAGSDFIEVFALVAGASGNVEAWYPQGVVGGWTGRGGDTMDRRVRSGGSWGSAETMATAGSRALGHPMPVANAHAGLRVLFTEVAQAVTDVAAMKRYAHGDSGFVIGPSSPTIQGETFADVSMQVDFSDKGSGTDASFASVVLLTQFVKG